MNNDTPEVKTTHVKIIIGDSVFEFEALSIDARFVEATGALTLLAYPLNGKVTQSDLEEPHA